MVHLQPLPGSPAAGTRAPDQLLGAAYERAQQDALTILHGGMDGVIVENFGDAPFYPGRVPPIVVASMAALVTRLAGELRARARSNSSPFLGINVLRNDAASALAIASVAGLDCIRVNIHCGAMVTDQGIIEGRAHETLRERERLRTDALIFADVLVKHATPLGGTDLDVGALAQDTATRGRADALIVTGKATGAATNLDRLRTVREAVPDVPVLVGSGVRADNIGDYAQSADGFIIGTALKPNGDVDAPVEVDLVKAIVREGRSSS